VYDENDLPQYLEGALQILQNANGAARPNSSVKRQKPPARPKVNFLPA
jgi:hypothetical protein